MKKLLSFLMAFAMLLSLLLLGSASALALGVPVWEKRYRQDVFGDTTKEWYLINKKQFAGTFNSAAAENARLGAESRQYGHRRGRLLYGGLAR